MAVIPNKQSTIVTVSGADTAFHNYTFRWSPGGIDYLFDGVVVSSHTITVPTTPAAALINLWGTNSGAFGGTATVGVTRSLYVSNFTFTPLAAVSFGVVGLGVTSSPMALTFQNVGTGPLTFSSITAVGDFAIVPGTNTCPVAPATLAATSTCVLSVAFTPTTAGNRNGSVIFTDNDPLGQQSASLTGVGQQSQIIPPTGILFQQGVIGVH